MKRGVIYSHQHEPLGWMRGPTAIYWEVNLLRSTMQGSTTSSSANWRYVRNFRFYYYSHAVNLTIIFKPC